MRSILTEQCCFYFKVKRRCIMPGIEIKDEDRRKIDQKFICALCKLLLCIPLKAACGHLMCQSCVQDILKYVNFSFHTFDNNTCWTSHLSA